MWDVCRPAYLLAGLLAGIAVALRQRAIWQKNGQRPSVAQYAGVLLLAVYMAVVFSLTIAPDYGYALHNFGRNINLVPLRVLATIAENPLNFWGNLLMFMPLGLLACLLSRRYRRAGWCLLAGAGLSLFIELCQLFTPRASDIDDLLMNTLGTALGWATGRLLLALTAGRKANSAQKCAARPANAGQRLRQGACPANSAPSSARRLQRRSCRDSALVPLTAACVAGAMLFAGLLPKEAFLFSADSGASSGEPSFSTDVPVLSSLPAQHIESSISPAALEAASALLLDLTSQTTLYASHETDPVAPASTTKLLTALTAWDFCAPNEIVSIGQEVTYIAADASRAGLMPGEELTVEQLYHAMLLPSGNDAAYALAVYAGRRISDDDSLSIEAALDTFIAAMNDKAAALGASNSHFVCPDGYDADGQYTTAADLACIAAAVLRQPLLSEICGTLSFSDTWPSGEQASFTNTNFLLDPTSEYYDPAVIGLKTGRSSAAGCCLVAAAKHGGDTYLTIVMGSSETGRWTDTRALFACVGL
ncbi:MAG: VanZ family protein [Faecalibacterium sp.]|nr:VanZ family protein [Faecalibacterium sp.]